MARAVDLDRLTAAGIRDGALRGRSVTVLGLARSGVAMARFFADAGAHVTVYDARSANELRPAIESLGDRAIELALGPGVEPAGAWAGAELVATSPSINPDFPTAEPRLRAALAALVAAHRADPVGSPALVSEPDLVLRLCPCPTIGVTGTKGKTTTSSLAAALLATDSDHPAILGGNIGMPLIERLPELTTEHRVVIELSELQLPTLSRGTTVAVYTNVTSDHLDRHGSLAAYRAVKRRLAEMVDPNGALVLNAEDPIVAAYADLGTAPAVIYTRTAPLPGGLGVEDGWIVAAGVPPLAAGHRAAGHRAAGGGAAVAPSEGGSCLWRSWRSPAPTTSPTRLPPWRSHSCSAFPPLPSARAAGAFTGVEQSPGAGRDVDGVRFINDSQGTQPDAVIAALRAFPRPLVLIAGGRDKGVDLSGLGPVAAGEGGCGGADRRVRTGAGGALSRVAGWPASSGRPRSRRRWTSRMRWRAKRWRRGRPTPATAAPRISPPCCSARPPRASTCSSTTRPAAWRSEARSPRWRAAGIGRPYGERHARGRPPLTSAHAAARNDLEPLGRVSRAEAGRPESGRSDSGRSERPAAARPLPVHSLATEPKGGPQRDFHDPDWVIVVAVVALAAVGILMVYSASAIPSYQTSQNTFQMVAPQIGAGLAGLAAMIVLARLDYRYLRKLSILLAIVALALLVLVLTPIGIESGGSSRAGSGSAPCSRSIRPRWPNWPWRSTWPTGWLPAARRSRASSTARSRSGSSSFRSWRSLPSEPDLGTTAVILLIALTLFFVAGANVVHLGMAFAGGAAGGAFLVFAVGDTPCARIQVFLDPWADPVAGYHTIKGLEALAAGGLFGTGLGNDQVIVPNDVQRLHLLCHRPGARVRGRAGRHRTVRRLRLGRDPDGAACSRHVRRPAGGRDHGLDRVQAIIHICVVLALVPVTGITLPFVSQGGSSLVVSFAAAGILAIHLAGNRRERLGQCVC